MAADPARCRQTAADFRIIHSVKQTVNALLLIAFGLLSGGLIWLIASRPRGVPVVLRPAPTPGPLVVHIVGAVRSPGVYELPRGARVRDAVEAAGGFAPGADQAALNLAAQLEDGIQLQAAWLESPADSGAPRQDSLIDINTAAREALEALPGIGPTIAGRIIEYRETHGPFEKISDIALVSGIGPSTYQQIKDLITVAP